MTKNTFDDLRKKLKEMSSSANINCRDFSRMLEKFGFTVLDASSGGHKIVEHPAFMRIPDDASSFNCGHSTGAKVKKVYISKFLKLVDKYEAQIREFLNAF